MKKKPTMTKDEIHTEMVERGKTIEKIRELFENHVLFLPRSYSVQTWEVLLAYMNRNTNEKHGNIDTVRTTKIIEEK